MLPISDTIVAQATAWGRGGVGVVRISGPLAKSISFSITSVHLEPRVARLCRFQNKEKELLDIGLALFFPGPNSFTGEDVVELQGHGGPIILDRIIQACLALGARIARPGEFSERAFLNGKIDLAQAEAIADVINAQTKQAAVAALRSLCGVFSEKITLLNKEVIQLRVYVEAAIDFPVEEIDFLSDVQIKNGLHSLAHALAEILRSADQGALLREGKKLVIVGAPNAGKSSLLNRWTGLDSAIVTHVPGTTRDLIQEQVSLDGIPVHLVDTAGIRFTEDVVELQGIEKAQKAMEQADLVLWLIDAQDKRRQPHIESCIHRLNKPTVTVYNKIDLTQDLPGIRDNGAYISAKTGAGFQEFLGWLKQKLGLEVQDEGVYIARRRHVDALVRAQEHLMSATSHHHSQQGELLAEELRLMSSCLQEITGAFTTDDLLGEIFSSFCIGK